MVWNVWIIKPFGFIQQASRGYKWGGRVNLIQLVCGTLSVDSCECAVGQLFHIWNRLDRCFQIQYVKWIRTVMRRNVTHLVWRMKKCMNPCPSLPGSTSSQSSSSPYFSSSTSENEDAVQTTYTRYSVPMSLKAYSACTRTPLTGLPKGKSPHINGYSSLLSFCCCSLWV